MSQGLLSSQSMVAMKPVIPQDVEINSPFYAIAAMVLTLAYPMVVMFRLRMKSDKSWKGFVKGAQMGAICAFLIQDFFCSLLVAFHEPDGSHITTLEDGTWEQRSSIVAYNPGAMSVALPAIMLLTLPFIRSSIWMGVVSASMVQQCLRLLLVILVKAPVSASEPKTSMVGVGDFYRTELLLGAACIPVALFLVVRHYNLNTFDHDEEDAFAEDDDLELAEDGEEGPSAKPLLAEIH